MFISSWNDWRVKKAGIAGIDRKDALRIILQKPTKSDLDVARGISIIEDMRLDISTLKAFIKNPILVDAYCLGITGAPGVGKSTFMNRLISTHDFGSHKVAILAIDPSSRITNGAVLGDRIRITQSSVFENLYFRSIASRGAYGGLSDSIETILYFLAVCGFTLVLIETVGVGQNEVDIAKYADLVIHILDSNAGDEVQMEKAGVMEVGDIYFVNIRDEQINHQFISNLQSFTSYSNTVSSRRATVVVGSALSGEGFGEISIQLDSLTNHFELVGLEAE
jgi:LAO/AO transport system kinase